MKLFAPQTVLIPNGGQESIIINGDNFEKDKLLFFSLTSDFLSKNLILLNPIQKWSKFIEFRIFNLNQSKIDSNPQSYMMNLMRGQNSIKINSGDEFAEFITLN